MHKLFHIGLLSVVFRNLTEKWRNIVKHFAFQATHLMSFMVKMMNIIVYLVFLNSFSAAISGNYE